MTDTPSFRAMQNHITSAIADAQMARGCDPDGDPCGGRGECPCLAMVWLDLEARAPGWRRAGTER